MSDRRNEDAAPQGSSGNGAGPRPNDRPATDALGRLARDAEAIREYATHYVAAKIDRFKATGRKLLILAVAGVLGLVALAVAFIMGVVLTIEGAAGGLAALFGDRPWLGSLIAGAILLTLVGGGFGVGALVWQRKARRRTERKYEKRRNRQEARFAGRLAPETSEGDS